MIDNGNKLQHMTVTAARPCQRHKASEVQVLHLNTWQTVVGRAFDRAMDPFAFKGMLGLLIKRC